VIYEYTLQAVNYLHQQGCDLIILACNTASAKALRTIQQNDINPDELRVLGVIRPTVELVPTRTRTNHIGVLATPGTVASESYVIELQKQNSKLIITQQACPMWVPLIESGEHLSEGADYFVEKYLTELLERDPKIDTIILGCTHYPLLQDKIEKFLAVQTITEQAVSVIAQGEIVAESLADYLERHPEIKNKVLTASDRDNSEATCQFLTTESASKFAESASMFLDEKIQAKHIEL
jgi:glutamate racemase